MKKILFTITLTIAVFFVFSQTKMSLMLEDFVQDHTFNQQTVSGVSSMNDGEHFTMLKGNHSIVRYSYKTGEELDVILNLNDIRDSPLKSISSYTFSANEQRILLETNKKPIYRHSYTAQFYVWDQYTKTIYEVSEYGPQQVATFSPDGERVAFVRENNIFMKTIRFGTEQQITFDGKKNEIINGIPDWVYEEEFGYNKALEWSTDSKMLAYVKFNETGVPEVTMPVYKGLSPEKVESHLYPGVSSFRFPKAGEKNALVSVHVYDVKTRTTIAMNTGEETDIYLPRITWTPDGNDLAIFRLNRIQNELNLLYANPHTGDTRTVFTERNKQYIDEQFLEKFTYLEDGKHFVVLSERDGWSHLYLYRNNGFLVKQLTSGQFDVTDFYGFDSARNLFFYQAAKTSPLQREVYSLTLDGKKDVALSEKAGTHKAVFGTGYNYFLNFYSSSTTPQTVSVFDRRSKLLRVMENNDQLKSKLSEYVLPTHEFFSFSNAQQVKLHGYMLKPSSFDPGKKYPVVMTQYSGPNSQEVKDSWEIDWHYYLAEQGYIVACVDPRGTAARGEEFRKSTYLQLGKLESDDLVDAARYLAALPYTDEKNMAIWGWSYGGFTTALCMNKGGELFKAGIAVAPVTNWRFYDTVYTERFMRTPRQNPDGYDDNSPISNVKGITGNLLLIHGSADDNVHLQNTMEYAEALVQADIPFDMHIYTNRNHSIFGGNTRMHLFKKMIGYFELHLK